MSTKEEDVIESILKGLNITKDRYKHIIFYIRHAVEDYKEDLIGIIKEIPLNLKENERYFAMFILGRSYSPLFYKMDDKEKTDFVVNIANILQFSDDRVALVAEYMTAIKIESRKKISAIDIIKMIINSKFENKEKDYMIFIFGLVGTV